MLMRKSPPTTNWADPSDAEPKSSLLPLKTEQLTFSVDDSQIINGVDLKLLDDAITVIMGPNGAGKSVLLRLLHGLLKPTSGTITWAGQAPSETIRKRQAMIFQRPVLLRRSVSANIEFALSLRGAVDPEQKSALLEAVGLTAQEKQPARALSGGEQQRLALARSLALNPEIMFLDEPTASLDPASTLRIEQLVQQIHDKGCKIIFVTHDIGQAKRLADDVVFLHSGKIAEHTSAATFFDDPSSQEAAAYLDGRLLL